METASLVADWSSVLQQKTISPSESTLRARLSRMSFVLIPEEKETPRMPECI
jgi:hypothetical protein